MKWILYTLVYLIFTSNLYATDQIVNLTIAYKNVVFAGKQSKAIAVNNQIPAPTLHFKEGDRITLNVYNLLEEETAIHWHGIIVPWQMDGVAGINQKPILPGKMFQYQFTLLQSGTYWYHSHAGLQEQRGLYGAIIIDPVKKPSYRYSKDYTIVLSDWSNTSPNKILANLKKEGDFYSPNFPIQTSLVKFIHDYQTASNIERKLLIDDYKMMQQMRMGIYDLSDVAYDNFLLNGRTSSNPWTASVKVGDVVRLRFIGASANTIFRIKIPDNVIHMVHIQGNDIQPYSVKDFTIAPGETYDALLKIQRNVPYIIYAESLDKVGAAYGALLTSANQPVNYEKVAQFPEPLPVTREMMSLMMSNKKLGTLSKNSLNKSSDNKLNQTSYIQTMPQKMQVSKEVQNNHQMSITHSMKMNMPTEPTLAGDKISTSNSRYVTTSETKYKNLIAKVKTNDPNRPIAGQINMELFGYMERYIWFINGVPEEKARPIILEPGKRYRFVFINSSMMHHPMHIHGHWFILRNGNGAYDPLLHTIDIAPGATITADVDTDASGQWIFHCHMLYHMMSGMSRTLQYSTLLNIIQGKVKPQNISQQTTYYNRPIIRVDELIPIDTTLVKYPMAHTHNFWFATFLDIGISPISNSQKVVFKGLYGSDYHKLELLTDDAKINLGKIESADLDIFYWHSLNQFWAIKGGVNYFYRPAKRSYLQPGIGIEGLMPYFIHTDIRSYFHKGSIKLDIELARDIQITNNFFIRAGVHSILASKTVQLAGIGNGLNQMRYILRPYYRFRSGFSIFIEFEHEQAYGRYKNILFNLGETGTQNTLLLGLSLLF